MVVDQSAICLLVKSFRSHLPFRWPSSRACGSRLPLVVSHVLLQELFQKRQPWSTLGRGSHEAVGLHRLEKSTKRAVYIICYGSICCWWRDRHNTLSLAVDHGNATILGYILFRRNGAQGHIDRIAVAEHHRRQGIGRRLLQFAIATLHTKRAKVLLLEVDTTNAGAIALYESLNFKRSTIRTDYYKTGRDALLMALRL